jgi:hypothetical protein
MALIAFPPGPSNGQFFPVSPPAGTNIYQWESATATWRLIGAASGVTAGCYGDSANIPTFCVDSTGRITSAGVTPVDGFVKLNNPVAYNNYIWPDSVGLPGTFLYSDGSGNIEWLFPPDSVPAGLGTSEADNYLKVSIPILSVPPVVGTGQFEGIEGSLYWDDTLGQLFIYYNDGASSQWVSASPPTPPPPGGTVVSVDTGVGLIGGPITLSGTVSLVPATTTDLGGVIPDGTTIFVDGVGVISTPPPLWERDGAYLVPTVAAQSVAIQDLGNNNVIRLVSTGSIYSKDITINDGTLEEWTTAPTRGLLNEVLTSNGDGTTFWASHFPQRILVSGSCPSINTGASATLDIAGFKTYALQYLTASATCWVVIYMDTTSRFNDSTRAPGTSPPPDSGIIGECQIAGIGDFRWNFTPALVGWNNDAAPSNTIYLRIVNNGTAATGPLTVSLQILQMER